MFRLHTATMVLAGGGLLSLLSGLAIRSCSMANEMWSTAWCGGPPAGWTPAPSLEHCLGCVMAGSGLVAIVAAAAFAIPRIRMSPT